MSIPTRDQFLFTESFDSLINSNNNQIFMVGGERKPSPGDAFHQEAIKYLKEVLNLPELDARAYKSIAYRTIKEQHPEAKHYERAEKMLELVKSKSFIKDFKDKLDETKSILENIDSEKEKRKSEEEPKQAGGNVFSETSVMQNYTESNVNQPYYQEYMQAKNQYLQSKLQKGGLNFLNGLINQPIPAAPVAGQFAVTINVPAPMANNVDPALLNFANLSNINNPVLINLNNGDRQLSGTIAGANIAAMINNRNNIIAYEHFSIHF
jgi:hypothetical protein